MTINRVNSIEQLEQLLNEFEKNFIQKITILFTASPDENAVCPLIKKTDANSKTTWCSDCNQAFPILEKILDQHLTKNPNVKHITVDVGDRNTWKDPNNLYRSKFNIQSIPTLYNHLTKSKISEGECLDEESIKQVLEF